MRLNRADVSIYRKPLAGRRHAMLSPFCFLPLSSGSDAGGGPPCHLLPLQLIPHSVGLNHIARVIMCLTSFFPPPYKLLWGRDPLILFTVVSLFAVTLPGSETLGRSCWINGHADCEVASRPLFSCPRGYSWQLQTCPGLLWSLLTKSLHEGKGSCLLTGQLPTALVERRAFLPFAVGVSQKLMSLL